MPYYIYRIREPLQLEYLDVKTQYKEAKSLIRRLREQHISDNPLNIRMMFAKTRSEAEKLLSAPRDGRVIGEE